MTLGDLADRQSDKIKSTTKILLITVIAIMIITTFRLAGTIANGATIMMATAMKGTTTRPLDNVQDRENAMRIRGIVLDTTTTTTTINRLTQKLADTFPTALVSTRNEGSVRRADDDHLH